MDDLNAFTGIVRRCVDDYEMIGAGDSIAVGVSGGKDSLVTLAALRRLQNYYPKPFTLNAVTCDMGFPDMDFAPVAAWCKELGVPYTLVKTDIREIVFDIRKEPNSCSLCAKMRKGALNNAALKLGCGKVALGHHLDDAVETFMMNLLLGGQVGCFCPVTHLDRSGITQIRPLLYAGEMRVAQLARKLELPVVKTTCPMDKTSKRRQVKDLIAELGTQYPDLKTKLFGAMQRLPLDGWERQNQ
jgi:tRNA 2-thiocytidine biosynthesis protein TtcA